MLNPSDWLLVEIEKYRRQKGREPTFLSDWDCEPADTGVIENIVVPSLTTSRGQLSRYSYAEDQWEQRSGFVNFVKNKTQLHLVPDNVSIALNATNALYLCLSALRVLGIDRFLVLTPVYYSIVETLHAMKASVVFHHLMDDTAFQIDVDAIERDIDAQSVQAVIFTDPVYSAGIEVSPDVYHALAQLSDRLGVWLICDYSLGGLNWDSPSLALFDGSKLQALQKTERFIYIDSLTKRLFLNGVKHAVTIAPSSLVNLSHDIASRVSGGFCASQLSVFTALYDPRNEPEIIRFLQNNRQRIRSHYRLFQAAITGTEYLLYPSNTGYFSMICHHEHRIKEVNSKDVVKRLLYKHDLYVLPSEHFYFNRNNHFGLRINLINDLAQSLPLLVQAVTKNTNLFDQAS